MTVLETPLQNRGTTSHHFGSFAFSRRNLILVEGQDDRRFLAKQITASLNPDDWHVHSMGGSETDWSSTIALALLDSRFQEHGHAIGVVFDADTDAGARLDRIKSLFAGNNLPVPQSHADVVKDDRWQVSGFVMPDGHSNGALEDLLLEAVDPARRDAASKFVDTAGRVWQRHVHPRKAELQTYFQTHKKFVHSTLVALERTEVIPTDHAVFEPVRAWLAALAADA